MTKADAQTDTEKTKGDLIFKYHGNTYERGIGTCEWLMYLPPGLHWPFLESARDRTDAVVALGSTARRNIRRENDNDKPAIYLLRIQGTGSDNRCTWCKSFRTYCMSNVTGQGYSFIKRGECKFD